MSLAAETRAAVRARPWLLRALRAGVVNYAAAAASLDVDGGRDAIATALRRFESDLPPLGTDARDVTVRMRRGVGTVAGESDDPSDGTAGDDALLSVDEAAITPEAGSLTAVTVDGDVDAEALTAVVGRLAAEGVAVEAAGVAGGRLVVAVPRREGADALRLVEDALSAIPAE